jgi:hypothetical protein
LWISSFAKLLFKTLVNILNSHRYVVFKKKGSLSFDQVLFVQLEEYLTTEETKLKENASAYNTRAKVTMEIHAADVGDLLTQQDPVRAECILLLQTIELVTRFQSRITQPRSY